MTTADLPPSKVKWYHTVSEEQARDLMGTLFDAEQSMYKAKRAAEEAVKKEREWHWRIEELRKHIHRQIGPKP